MWSSIKSAFKIICSDKYSIGEKAFEVTKVLTAGFVSVIGFSLNELLEKGLTSIGIPPAIASFIADCLSGLFAGIMSAVVLMLFDNLKKYIKSKSNEVRIMQLKSRKLCIEISHMTLDSLRFYKKLDGHISLALSPVTSTSLAGSISVCEDLQVSQTDIVKTTQDVDALIGKFRK
jgi:hypothetical protein